MKKKLFWSGMLAGALALIVLGASVPFASFNSSQFSTNNNNVAVKSGALMTNLFFYDNQGNQFWYTNNGFFGNSSSTIGNVLQSWSAGYFESIFLPGGLPAAGKFLKFTDTSGATAPASITTADVGGLDTNKFVLTNETRVISATNTSNTFGYMQARTVNTNIYTGAGTVTASINSQSWTISGGTMSPEMYGGFIIINVIHQFKISEVTDSTHFRTLTPADASYSSVAWRYYSNYHIFYDSVPNVVATVDGGGGYNIKSFEFANDGGVMIGSGVNVVRLQMENNFGGAYGPGMSIRVDGNKIPYFFSTVAPNNTLMSMADGYSWLLGISNQAGATIPVKVPLQLTTGSPGAGKVWTATDSSGSGVWSNATGSASLIVTNYVNLAFNTNIPTTTLYTPSGHTMYEVSATYSMGGAASLQTNTLTISWQDDVSNSNSVNIIDHLVKSTTGSVGSAPFTFVAANNVTISFTLTQDGATGSSANNLRICLKELQ